MGRRNYSDLIAWQKAMKHKLKSSCTSPAKQAVLSTDSATRSTITSDELINS